MTINILQLDDIAKVGIDSIESQELTTSGRAYDRLNFRFEAKDGTVMLLSCASPIGEKISMHVQLSPVSTEGE